MSVAIQKYKEESRLRKRKRLIHKGLATLIIVAIALAGLVYLFFFSKVFEIKTAQISQDAPSQLAKLVNDWLDRKALGISRRNNILFVSVVKLTSLITAQFPELDSIAVKKTGHTLAISFELRKPIGVWCLTAQKKCFNFDRNFIAYAVSGPTSGPLLISVNDNRDKEVKLGSVIDGLVWLRNIETAKDSLTNKGINIAEFSIPAGSFDEFGARATEGWRIMFSNQTNIAEQVNSLADFLKQKISTARRSQLEYVDLRIQDRIYYK